MIDNKLLALTNKKLTTDEEKKLEQFLKECNSSIGIKNINRNNIKDYVKVKTSSGIKDLDNLLSGGFSQGVNVIGAEPGIGKTTLCIQIATNMIKSGTPVFYYSLEVGKNDIYAKILSAELFLKFGNDDNLSLSMDQISSSEAYKLNAKQWDAIDSVKENLDKVLNDLIICDAFVGVSDIVEMVTNYIRKTNKKPFIIIDYLQKLSVPDAYKLNDKLAADNSMEQLTKLSNTLGVSVLAISSLSRKSYTSTNKGLSIDSFKESGQIEYTAVTLLTMELANVANEDNDKKISRDEAMAAMPRKLKLTLQKSRNGAVEKPIILDFYSKNNMFVSENEVITTTFNNEIKYLDENEDLFIESKIDDQEYIEMVDDYDYMENYDTSYSDYDISLSEIEEMFNYAYTKQ